MTSRNSVAATLHACVSETWLCEGGGIGLGNLWCVQDESFAVKLFPYSLYRLSTQALPVSPIVVGVPDTSEREIENITTLRVCISAPPSSLASSRLLSRSKHIPFTGFILPGHSVHSGFIMRRNYLLQRRDNQARCS